MAKVRQFNAFSKNFGLNDVLIWSVQSFKCASVQLMAKNQNLTLHQKKQTFPRLAG